MPARRTAVVLLAAALAAAGCGVGHSGASPAASVPSVPDPSVAVPSVPVPSVAVPSVPVPSDSAPSSPVAAAPPTPIPTDGPGTWEYADGTGAVLGTAGPVRSYHVAVETGMPVSAAEFAAEVDATLGDPRSWIGGGDLRLQRVPDGSPAAFTVRLASGGTTQRLCNAAGLDIFWRGEPYTSCYDGASSVINLNRYEKGIPDYGSDLADYRQYAINHEVGHALGHGHELCPGTGQLAPVMQQQTFGLRGCLPNAWPYVDGQRYAGPPGTITPTD
jgi:hypothetical protein